MGRATKGNASMSTLMPANIQKTRMMDFIERSLRRLGGQFAGHISMAGDDGNVKPTAIWAKTVTRELRGIMQGRVVSRGDDDYSRTRQVWNRAVEDQPALIAVCETSADVQAAVRSARQHRLPLSVRGGAHDWVGRALRPDGLVVDLSQMRQVIVDPHSRVATVAGGAKAKDVAAAAFDQILNRFSHGRRLTLNRSTKPSSGGNWVSGGKLPSAISPARTDSTRP